MAEQLKIDATLDTSQIKQNSKKAANDLNQDLKSVENQSKQTSKAIDSIGNASKSAASGASSLKQSYTQALDAIDAKAKAVKDSMRQMSLISMGAGLVNTAAGAISKTEWGQSDVGQDVTGAMSGAASGAMMGMSIGSMIAPGIGTAIGAAAGALLGAATGLMGAAQEQKAAAQATMRASSEQRATRVQSYIDERNKQVDQMWMERDLGKFAGLSTEDRQYSMENLQKQLKDTYAQYEKDIFAYRSNEMRHDESGDLSVEREFNRNQEELYRQIEEARKKMEKYNALLQGMNDIVEREKKSTEDREKAAQAETTSSLKSEMSRLQSDIASESGRSVRISDSLVKVGGGGSYAGVNNAINSNVAKIVTTLNQLLKTAQQTLAATVGTKVLNTSTVWG